MPSFEDVTPSVLQSSVPQESRANLKNKVFRNYFFLVVWGSALVFSKVGNWGLCSLPPCDRDSSPQLWCEENPERGGHSGRCAVGESHKYIRAVVTHVHTPTRSEDKHVCTAHCFTADVGLSTSTNRHHNGKLKKIAFLHKPVSTCPINKKQTYPTITAVYAFEKYCTPSVCDKLSFLHTQKVDEIYTQILWGYFLSGSSDWRLLQSPSLEWPSHLFRVKGLYSTWRNVHGS